MDETDAKQVSVSVRASWSRSHNPVLSIDLYIFPSVLIRDESWDLCVIFVWKRMVCKFIFLYICVLYFI